MINQIKIIIQFANNKAMKLVSVGQSTFWCDVDVETVTDNPFEYYVDAEYVITNTFHGTLFAIKYNKQFITFANNNRKIIELLDFFDLRERNINEGTDISKVIDIPIDYDKVNEIIDNNILESKEYINEFINIIQDENRKKR